MPTVDPPLVSVRFTVSFASAASSLGTATSNVLVVSPGAKASVPLAEV